MLAHLKRTMFGLFGNPSNRKDVLGNPFSQEWKCTSERWPSVLQPHISWQTTIERGPGKHRFGKIVKFVFVFVYGDVVFDHTRWKYNDMIYVVIWWCEDTILHKSMMIWWCDLHLDNIPFTKYLTVPLAGAVFAFGETF